MPTIGKGSVSQENRPKWMNSFDNEFSDAGNRGGGLQIYGISVNTTSDSAYPLLMALPKFFTFRHPWLMHSKNRDFNFWLHNCTLNPKGNFDNTDLNILFISFSHNYFQIRQKWAHIKYVLIKFLSTQKIVWYSDAFAVFSILLKLALYILHSTVISLTTNTYNFFFQFSKEDPEYLRSFFCFW